MALALTGATGFIGTRILTALGGRAGTVRALTRHPVPQEDSGIDWVHGDLESPDALDALVADADTVIHLAGTVGGRRQRDFLATNVNGTRNLLRAVQRTAPDTHLVLVSSLAAREPRLSWYAASKRMAEELVITGHPRQTVIRPPAVYGPGDPALAGFWKALARGWLLRAGPARQRFSLIHVDDLAGLVLAVADHGLVGGILEPDDGRPGGWSWPDLAAVAAGVRGAPVRTVPIPAAVLGIAGAINCLPRPWRHKPPVLSPGKVRELVHPDWVCDNTALATALNWSPQARLAERLATLPGWNSRT